MKRFLFISTLFALAMLFASSCTSTLPSRFDRFVDHVEKNAPSYTEEDWQGVANDFNDLLEKYEKVYNKLSKEQRDQINEAIVSYRGLVFKYKVKGVIQSFEKALEDFSNNAKGVWEGIGHILKELGDDGEE